MKPNYFKAQAYATLGKYIGSLESCDNISGKAQLIKHIEADINQLLKRFNTENGFIAYHQGVVVSKVRLSLNVSGKVHISIEPG